MAIPLPSAYGWYRSKGLNDEQASPLSKGSVDRSLALARSDGIQTWADPDWQRFWLTVDRLSWQTLALVPAGPGGPRELTLSLAVTLSRTGMTHLGGPIQVADGTHVPINELNGFQADVRSCQEAGQRVIIALPAVSATATAASIAKFSDAVVLCVLLERMTSSDAKKTVQQIGPEKFLGSVILRSDKSKNVSK